MGIVLYAISSENRALWEMICGHCVDIVACVDHIDSNSCWLNPVDLSSTDHNRDSNTKRTGDLWMKPTQPVSIRAMLKQMIL